MVVAILHKPFCIRLMEYLPVCQTKLAQVIFYLFIVYICCFDMSIKSASALMLRQSFTHVFVVHLCA